MLGCNGTECYKEFVVYCTCVVQEGPNNFLDSVLAVIIKEGRGINFRGELCFGTIRDREACVGRESSLERAGMLEFHKQIVNISGHAEATPFTSIVPCDADASKFVSSHVELYPMVFL